MKKSRKTTPTRAAETQVLRPTLWRTCRALLNPLRLHMVRLAIEYDGTLCVRQYARILQIPDSIASIYLRQLGSRGLLGVKRDEIKVFYNGDTDQSLPDSVALQTALRDYLGQKELPEDWTRELMTILRAFTHFNRLAILIRLAKGPATATELGQAIGTCVKSLYHHFGFLHAAGLLSDSCAYGTYELVPPKHPFARVLLKILLQDQSGAERYYNEGTGTGRDTGTRRVLRKISAAEGNPVENWRSTGPMKTRKGNFTSESR